MEYLYFTLDTGAALVMGAVLGLERQYQGHPAGLRINALVSVGAALFVSVSTLFSGIPGVDPTRITAYVVTGIGFLGGGVIIREGLNVRGMNTAATLWCTAAIGVLCGLGFPLEALLGTAIVLFVHVTLRPLGHWIDTRRKTALDVEMAYHLRVICKQGDEALIRTILMRHINARPRMTVQGISTADGDQPGHAAVIADIFSMERNDHAMDEIMSRLNIEPSVIAVSWGKKT
jgi:putative Mg2+ transporter-C (MgtC) family protein